MYHTYEGLIWGLIDLLFKIPGLGRYDDLVFL